MPHDPYKALYIHVPFCASRCDYCDFHTEAIKPESRAIDRYFDSLIERLRDLSREGELAQVKTVYVGGGTPTHAGSKNLTQLLYALGVSMHLDACVECTIEANPESLNERLVADIWALGANRLSIGVQSFDDALLGSIGRIHSADDAKRAIECAHTRFSNVSVDLMCGLPGQTLRQGIRLGSFWTAFRLVVFDVIGLAFWHDFGQVVKSLLGEFHLALRPWR